MSALLMNANRSATKRGTGSVTNYTSVRDIFNGIPGIPPLAGIPEFAIWSRLYGHSIQLGAAASRLLLNGDY